MIRCICLHGNFGTSSDWAPVERALGRTLGAVECVCPDLWALGRKSWRRELCDLYTAVRRRGGRTVVIGYSLGARLSLDLLGEPAGEGTRGPARFGGEGVIACSVNPGIRAPAEREARRAADARWAAQLLDRSVSLREIFAAWSAQPALIGAVEREPPVFPSVEAELRFRATVADRLVDWSVGTLSPAWEKLRVVETPVLCLAGERDAAFTVHLDAIRSLGNAYIATTTVSGGSHRFPFEDPDSLVGAVAQFLQRG